VLLICFRTLLVWIFMELSDILRIQKFQRRARMNRTFLIAALFTLSSLGSLAHATVTWSFGANPTLVGQGAAYGTTPTGGTIRIFSEQVYYTGPNAGKIVSTITTYNGTATLGTGSNALFATNNSVFANGIGVAPYNVSQDGNGS